MGAQPGQAAERSLPPGRPAPPALRRGARHLPAWLASPLPITMRGRHTCEARIAPLHDGMQAWRSSTKCRKPAGLWSTRAGILCPCSRSVRALPAAKLRPCVPELAYHAGIWDGLFSTVDLVSLYWTFAARSLAVATPLQRSPIMYHPLSLERRVGPGERQEHGHQPAQRKDLSLQLRRRAAIGCRSARWLTFMLIGKNIFLLGK